MREALDESNNITPLLLILTPGNDPMEQIEKVAAEAKAFRYPISLGKG